MIGVIGGSGFIGSALVHALRQSGHEVRIIDRARSERYPESWIEADVCDREALTAAIAGCTTLYNLAAEHRDDIRPASLYYQVNVTGAEHVCAAAEAHGINRMIFTSTVAVYGTPAGEVDESAPLRPFNHYGRSKLQAEQVFRAWASRGPGRSLTIIRPTVVFGPNNRGNVYTLLEQVARRRAFVVGNGHNRKSMACVENVVGVLVHALTLAPGVHIFNYADKPDLDMNELIALARATLGHERELCIRIPYLLAVGAGVLADLAARLTGLQFPLSAIRVRKYHANTQFSNSGILATGFVPRHQLREALIATIRHEFGSHQDGTLQDRPTVRQCRPCEEPLPADRR